MFYYLKKYPVSLCIILLVIYLSFFRPPQPDEIPTFPGMDKAVHFLMYFGMSGMLWLEYGRAHRLYSSPLWHVWVGGFLCPILFSGIVELLQAYCTTYRGGEWMDLAANAAGVLTASLLGCRALRFISNS